MKHFLAIQPKQKRLEELLELSEEVKQNPVQVLIKALENTTPREDVTRAQMGGVSYQISVDVSATRRLDVGLRNIALAALMKCFNNPKSLAEALADEIIAASREDMQSSYAVRRKDEIERIVKAASYIVGQFHHIFYYKLKNSNRNKFKRFKKGLDTKII